MPATDDPADRWTMHVGEWNREHDKYEACWPCFRQYTLPVGWVDPPYDSKHSAIIRNEDSELAKMASDDSSDDSSSTDMESDTDADVDAIPTASLSASSSPPTTAPSGGVTPVPMPPGAVVE